MAYSFISQSFLIFMYKLTVNLQYISSLSFHLSIKSAHIPLLYLLSEAQSIRSNSQCPLLPCSPCRRLPSDSPSSRRARRAWRPPASYAARATRPSSSSAPPPLGAPGTTPPPAKSSDPLGDALQRLQQPIRIAPHQLATRGHGIPRLPLHRWRRVPSFFSPKAVSRNSLRGPEFFR